MATIRTAIALYDGVTSPLQGMKRAMDIVLNSFEAMQTASGNSVDASSIQQAREELARVETAFDGIEESVRQANEQQQKFNGTIQGGSSAADGLWRRLKGIAATVGSLAAMKKVVGISDELAGTRARLDLLVDDNGSVEELEKKIMASAQRSRAAYFDTASAVASMGANAKAAFDGTDEIIAFMEQVNKQFVIGGASAQGQSAAMLQLTQAMAAGALRGEELNSILENAPGIARAIERYMGAAEGSIKQYAEEGLVTAEVVKNAMFYAADETNAKFESMPKTWAQVWTSMQNKALSIFNPILGRINEIANSERFARVMDGLINGLAAVGAVAAGVFDLLVSGASWVVDNWSWLAPIIGGVAAAYFILNGAMLAYNTIQAISAARSAIKAGASLTEAAATTTAAGAQVGLNAALLACPLVWIIVLMIALTALFYGAVAAINHFAGTSISATGVIAGVFGSLLASVGNSMIYMYNLFAAAGNFLANVFRDPAAAVEMLFLDLSMNVIGFVRSMASVIERLLNAIPGVSVNITGALDNIYGALEKEADRVKSESGWVEVFEKKEFIDTSDAYDKGYQLGQGLEDKVSGWFDFSAMDSLGAGDGLDAFSLGNSLDGIYGAASDTAGNTAAMTDALDIAEEDLAYMRDIAEREAINRCTTAEIRVEQRNENHISRDTDLDGIMDAWANDFAEKLDVSGEGVHD